MPCYDKSKFMKNLKVKNKKRNPSLDMVRSIAIFLVVLCHVAQSVYNPLSNDSSISNLNQSAICFLFISLGRLGVPLFLLLTGSLLLNKKYSSKEIKIFYIKRYLWLLLCVWSWIIVYSIFLSTCGNEQFSIKLTLKRLLFMEYINMPHYWYLPMILGIYIFIPFLSHAVKNINTKWIILISIVILTITFGISTLNASLSPTKYSVPPIILNLSLSGGFPVMYLIYGYLITERKIFKNWKTRIIVLLFLFGLIITQIQQIIIFNFGEKYDLWYDNLFLFITTIFLFELLKRIKFKPIPKLFYTTSKLSFGIYLVHYPILIALLNLNIQGSLADFSATILYSIILFITSWLFVLITSKIPIIGKLMYYIKS